MIDEGGEESAWLEEKSYFRAKSAPARPLTEIEEFKKSKTFSIMERAVVSSTHLIQTYNSRYDIDSTEGQIACKTFLKLLEKLHEVIVALLRALEPKKPAEITGISSQTPTRCCTKERITSFTISTR
jgi:hypothetical protein